MSQVVETTDIQNRSLIESMGCYDATTASTQEIRNQLVAKMLPSILNMQIDSDPTTDPDLYASQARMISEFRQLLNDRDTADRNNVQVKLKQKDSEVAAQNSFNVAEFLKQVKFSSQGGGNPFAGASDMNIIDAKALVEQCALEQGCEVLDTELEMGQTPLPEKPVKDAL